MPRILKCEWRVCIPKHFTPKDVPTLFFFTFHGEKKGKMLEFRMGWNVWEKRCMGKKRSLCGKNEPFVGYCFWRAETTQPESAGKFTVGKPWKKDFLLTKYCSLKIIQNNSCLNNVRCWNADIVKKSLLFIVNVRNRREFFTHIT